VPASVSVHYSQLFQYGDLGRKLQVDQKREPTIHLKELGCLFRAQSLFEFRPVLLSQIYQLGIDVEQALRHVCCLGIIHGGVV